MPTTKALLIFSWVAGTLGLVTSGYLAIFKFNGPDSVISGILILFAGLLLTIAIRTFANVGQMVYDIKFQLYKNLNCDTKDINQNIHQINCDSKDINQNIDQIKVFFERIAGHLDLKR